MQVRPVLIIFLIMAQWKFIQHEKKPMLEGTIFLIKFEEEYMSY